MVAKLIRTPTGVHAFVLISAMADLGLWILVYTTMAISRCQPGVFKFSYRTAPTIVLLSSLCKKPDFAFLLSKA